MGILFFSKYFQKIHQIQKPGSSIHEFVQMTLIEIQNKNFLHPHPHLHHHPHHHPHPITGREASVSPGPEFKKLDHMTSVW